MSGLRAPSAAALVVCLAVSACGRKGAAPAPESKTRRVDVVAAQKSKLPRRVVAVGTLAADEHAALGFKIAGRIERFDVDLGSRVGAGAVLARLEKTDYELRLGQAKAAVAQARARLGLSPDGHDDTVVPENVGTVRQAKARLDEANAQLARSRELSEQGILARSAFDTVEATQRVAESLYADALEEVSNRLGILAERRSALALAEENLAATVLRAPFAGGVQQRSAGIGEYVAAGTPVVTLVQVSPLRLRLDIPEREAANIRKGQEVTVRVEGDEQVYPGRIARLAAGLDESNRSLTVEAEVDNSKGLLRPGSFARGEIVTDSGAETIAVPVSAVVVFAGIQKVITVKDGKAVERPVTTGRQSGETVEIVAGLAEGEPVVVKPAGLATGVAVDVGVQAAMGS
jgi:RND family efflux transporter MFP subunit